MKDCLGEIIKNIKNLKIQGAHHIAEASLKFLQSYADSNKLLNSRKFVYKLDRAIAELIKVRPTEPLAHNLLTEVKSLINKSSALPTKQINKLIDQKISLLIDQLATSEKNIQKFSSKLIKNGQNIFTHCHSSEVESILVAAENSGKRFKVFNTETRPLLQGRITAKNLIKHNIPVTMVADSAAGFLISEGSGKKVMMDIAFLGADAILPDGSVINKIGSYGIALSCFYTKVPIYIVSTLLKYDPKGLIKIEIRPEEEIWPDKPKGLKIINFAFDKIPVKFITGIICEFGIIKPNQIKKYVSR